MNSKKSYLLVIALAVLGAVAFSKIEASPAITFVIGVFTCALVLSLSNPSSEQDKEEKPATTTLYVGNLPYKANESHVRQLFSEYGQVFAVRLMKDKRTGKRRGFGFVVVASDDSKAIIENLNEKDYMERTLKVRVANDPKHPDSDEALS